MIRTKPAVSIPEMRVADKEIEYCEQLSSEQLKMITEDQET